jgi:hypothetical protein
MGDRVGRGTVPINVRHSFESTALDVSTTPKWHPLSVVELLTDVVGCVSGGESLWAQKHASLRFGYSPEVDVHEADSTGLVRGLASAERPTVDNLARLCG